MKRALFSSLIRRSWELAVLLALCTLSACELFEEPDTCKETTESAAIWNPYMGITGYKADMDKGVAVWFTNLRTESGWYHVENVCPNAPFHLEINVQESTSQEEFQAYAYSVFVGYQYGIKFSNFHHYPAVRTSPSKWEAKIVGIPDVLGIMQTAATVYVSVWAEVPYQANKDAMLAGDWAIHYIDRISLTAKYTRYK
jgi:hypothetical protein